MKPVETSVCYLKYITINKTLIKPINLIKDYKDRGGIIAFLDLTQRLIILRYDSKLFKDYIWYLISNKFYPPDIYHRKNINTGTKTPTTLFIIRL